MDRAVHDGHGMGAQRVHQHLGAVALQVVQAQDHLREGRHELGEPGLVPEERGPAAGIGQDRRHLADGPHEHEVARVQVVAGQLAPVGQHVVTGKPAASQVSLVRGGQVQRTGLDQPAQIDMPAEPGQNLGRCERLEDTDAFLPGADSLRQVGEDQFVAPVRPAAEGADVSATRNRAAQQTQRYRFRHGILLVEVRRAYPRLPAGREAGGEHLPYDKLPPTCSAWPPDADRAGATRTRDVPPVAPGAA